MSVGFLGIRDSSVHYVVNWFFRAVVHGVVFGLELYAGDSKVGVFESFKGSVVCVYAGDAAAFWEGVSFSEGTR